MQLDLSLPIFSDYIPVDVKRIPYGISDYRRLLEEDGYYVDKTPYIRLIEVSPLYLFLLRPRRIGKSLLLSMLYHYYDVNNQERFEQLFGDTYIGQNPTPHRTSYLTMCFNFSMVSPELSEVRESFTETVNNEINDFLTRYERFYSAEDVAYIKESNSIQGRLQRIFYHATRHQLKTYLFIDEYDNFTNTILANQGVLSYHKLTHGAGFFRHFFNLLKGLTGGQISGLTRLFITGVSPVTMDDVTSGFNIGHDISQERNFNEMVGLTENEVIPMLHYYHDHNMLPLTIDETMAFMKRWYNNYYFGVDARTSMFNSDMVFHFLLRASQKGQLPDELIDPNIRTDYSKLRHLMTVDRQLQERLRAEGAEFARDPAKVNEAAKNPAKEEPKPVEEHKLNGNFSELKKIIQAGETISTINGSFPVEALLERTNFISLLYYMGFLTVAGNVEGDPLLKIPNR
ncbi:MAG: AAA family ATPase, partial [Chloroflexota bacterium]